MAGEGIKPFLFFACAKKVMARRPHGGSSGSARNFSGPAERAGVRVREKTECVDCCACMEVAGESSESKKRWIIETLMAERVADAIGPCPSIDGRDCNVCVCVYVLPW